MRRIVNMRIMLIVALCEIALILMLYLFGISRVASVVLQIVFYAFLLTALGLSIKFGKKKLLVALILCLCLSAGTSLSYGLRLHFYHAVVPASGETYTVSGRIDAVTTENGVVRSVTLKDLVIDEQTVRGKAQIIFEEDDIPFDTFTLGYKLTAQGALYNVALVNGSTVNGTAYRKNLRYKLYASYQDAQLVAAKPSALVRMRSKLYQKLQEACGSKYGAIAYCMLTGDKNELDTTVLRLYSMSGIAHVLAVSGFHVGILCALLQFVLKRLRVGKVPRFVAVTVALCLYAVFAGLGASVLRACIMCVIAMGILLHGERKDPLSALCFTFSVLLTVEPFLLFEVGFLMSFTTVLGLIQFSQPFTAALRKIKIPNCIATPLASTAAVSLVVMPITAFFFNTVQTYSILFNLLLIPVITVTFVFFLLVLPVSLLFNWNILLQIGSIGFAAADIGLGIAEYLPFAVVSVFSHKALFLTYPLLFVASRFFMLPKKGKVATACTVTALCLLLTVAPTLATLQPPQETSMSIIPVNGYGDVTSIVVDDNITVIGDVKDVTALESTLKSHRIRKIDTILLHKLTEQIGNGLTELVHDFKVRQIICPIETMEHAGLAALGRYKHVYALEESSLPNIRELATPTRHIGYLYTFSEDMAFISVGYSAKYTDIGTSALNRAAIIRCFMYLNAVPDRIYLTNMPQGYLGESPSYQFSLADRGNYIYKVVTGDLLKQK